jgi:hypothetical protein
MGLQLIEKVLQIGISQVGYFVQILPPLLGCVRRGAENPTREDATRTFRRGAQNA